MGILDAVARVKQSVCPECSGKDSPPSLISGHCIYFHLEICHDGHQGTYPSTARTHNDNKRSLTFMLRAYLSHWKCEVFPAGAFRRKSIFISSGYVKICKIVESSCNIIMPPWKHLSLEELQGMYHRYLLYASCICSLAMTSWYNDGSGTWAGPGGIGQGMDLSILSPTFALWNSCNSFAFMKSVRYGKPCFQANSNTLIWLTKIFCNRM